ncbi:hypothetical protein PoB_006811900 [Plakobranchus ocellatus]|uniref:Uncharacterized protein n=1 Tax=Plakobranchus ocellatus TaxID=259542 RepID=A0AAV4DBN8_9GAST|nr:hypothetical protein PoB_006811900 [Plakobranchus ocellatus]
MRHYCLHTAIRLTDLQWYSLRSTHKLPFVRSWCGRKQVHTPQIGAAKTRAHNAMLLAEAALPLYPRSPYITILFIHTMGELIEKQTITTTTTTTIIIIIIIIIIICSSSSSSSSSSSNSRSSKSASKNSSNSGNDSCNSHNNSRNNNNNNNNNNNSCGIATAINIATTPGALTQQLQ